jgi:GntR family transcriptional repressor for pyruvate dehydrogenase complex
MNQRTDRPAGSGQRPALVAGERTSQSIFAPIEPPTVFEKAVERLARAIALGLLSPGEQLPTERELALQLDISRPTLRQALVVLQQSGYLESRRGRSGGTWVVDRSASADDAPPPLAVDWSDSLDYRLAIEVGCVMLAATRATAGDLNALQELVAAMDAAKTYEEFRRFDIRFHLGIAECTGNRRLIDAMAEAQELMTGLFQHMVERPQMVWATSNRQHEQIVLALRDKDAQTAARVACEHVESSRHILSGLTSAGRQGANSRRRRGT